MSREIPVRGCGAAEMKPLSDEAALRAIKGIAVVSLSEATDGGMVKAEDMRAVLVMVRKALGVARA